MSRQIHSVTTMTPLRVSFMGGGTDFPRYFKEHGGIVVSAGIQTHVYVTVMRHSPLFGERYRISYSETERRADRDSIENGIVRGCLELLGVDEPLHISTSADVPAMSGLGSSSSFAIGLLLALHAMRGEDMSAAALAEEACRVELHVLGKPIGIQDQYAAAFGGLNAFHFASNGRVMVEPISQQAFGAAITDGLFLVWTGVQRKAEQILADQDRRTEVNIQQLDAMKALANELLSEMHGLSLSRQGLADFLNKGWAVKRSLSNSISSPEVDDFQNELLTAGSIGGKLLGAGGGGFMLAVVPQENRDSFLTRMRDRNPIPLKVDPLGARILNTVEK
jgi:D-glycero-alpha-D-manno-heptose-7-phosphate kinase